LNIDSLVISFVFGLIINLLLNVWIETGIFKPLRARNKLEKKAIAFFATLILFLATVVLAHGVPSLPMIISTAIGALFFEVWLYTIVYRSRG
jgi:hypothetical protein